MSRRAHAPTARPAARGTRPGGVAAGRSAAGHLPKLFLHGAGRAAADVLALQRLAGNRAVEHAISVGREVVGHGDCSGPELQCSATASRTSSKAISVPAPKKAKNDDDSVTYKGKGKLTATFTTKVDIALAKVPPGLSKCAAAKYKSLIENDLKPHEQDHKKRFKTTDPEHSYNGTVKKKLEEAGDDPGAVQESIRQQLSDEFDTELSTRETRNEEHAINAIDPFHVTADISECPECNPEE